MGSPLLNKDDDDDDDDDKYSVSAPTIGLHNSLTLSFGGLN